MLKAVVCVSGGGTNLQAILDAIENGIITNTQITAVISNNKNAYALERAKKAGIEGICLSPKDYEDRTEFNAAFCEKMRMLQPDLIVLAGFLVNIPAEMVQDFSNRIINIHPSLIPSFCGVGYYGLKVHEKALARGVTELDSNLAAILSRESWGYSGAREVTLFTVNSPLVSVPVLSKITVSVCASASR